MSNTDSTSLAVAFYLNGTNFRASAERLMEGLDLAVRGGSSVPAHFHALLDGGGSRASP
jgi:hypothetical protein